MQNSEQNITAFAIRFAVKNDARFLSHRDTMRLWQRALSRSRIPVSYSQGFNPHMKMTLPLPRSVGMSSTAELLIIKLHQPVSGQTLSNQLTCQLPGGFEVIDVSAIPAKLSVQPHWSSYRIVLSSRIDKVLLERDIQIFMDSATWPFNRPKRKRHPARTIDLRCAVRKMALGNNEIICTVEIQQTATARMDEILGALNINSTKDVREIQRIATGYPDDLVFDCQSN